MMLTIFKRVLAVLAIIILIFGVYFLLVRPYQLHWGATDQEIAQVMPGDQLDPQPEFFATRGITISGTPEEIWPWLLQMGYCRAGYYGYDLIENLGSPQGMRSTERILPEFQEFKVGDIVPISSVASMTFYAIEPNEYLIWTGLNQQGSFLWALYPVDEDHTRLISRIRWSFHWDQPDLLPLDVFTEFTDFIAVREILFGVKGRVENQIEPMARQNIEIAAYLAALLIYLAAIIWVIIRPLIWKHWLTGLAGGIVWLFVWYAPVSVWFSIGLEMLVIYAIFSRRNYFSKTDILDR